MHPQVGASPGGYVPGSVHPQVGASLVGCIPGLVHLWVGASPGRCIPSPSLSPKQPLPTCLGHTRHLLSSPAPCPPHTCPAPQPWPRSGPFAARLQLRVPPESPPALAPRGAAAAVCRAQLAGTRRFGSSHRAPGSSRRAGLGDREALRCARTRGAGGPHARGHGEQAQKPFWVFSTDEE